MKNKKNNWSKKYDAIEEYIEEVCPKSSYEKYNKELNSLITDVPIEEWLRKKKELEKSME